MGKLIRFFSEAGALGVGGVLFAFVLWAIALAEHYRDKNIPALWLLLGGCAAYSYGAFRAWSVADDRADSRKPKLGFSADKLGFYLTHLEGGAARFIHVEGLRKGTPGTAPSVDFDSVDFLGPRHKCQLTPHLRIGPLVGPQVQTDMGKIFAVMFGDSQGYPITIKFLWNDEWLEEKVWLYVGEKRTFFTRPCD